jgi:hypothetical protein
MEPIGKIVMAVAVGKRHHRRKHGTRGHSRSVIVNDLSINLDAAL